MKRILIIIALAISASSFAQNYIIYDSVDLSTISTDTVITYRAVDFNRYGSKLNFAFYADSITGSTGYFNFGGSLLGNEMFKAVNDSLPRLFGSVPTDTVTGIKSELYQTEYFGLKYPAVWVHPDTCTGKAYWIFYITK